MKIKIKRVYVEKKYYPDGWVGVISKAKIDIQGKTQTISSLGWRGQFFDLQKPEIINNLFQSLGQQLLALGLGKRSIEYAVRQWDGEIIQK